jgi:hypothetical protein
MKYFEMQSNYSNLMNASLAMTLPYPSYSFVPIRRFASGRLQNVFFHFVARSRSISPPFWKRRRSSQIGAAKDGAVRNVRRAVSSATAKTCLPRPLR